MDTRYVCIEMYNVRLYIQLYIHTFQVLIRKKTTQCYSILADQTIILVMNIMKISLECVWIQLRSLTKLFSELYNICDTKIYHAFNFERLIINIDLLYILLHNTAKFSATLFASTFYPYLFLQPSILEVTTNNFIFLLMRFA